MTSHLIDTDGQLSRADIIAPVREAPFEDEILLVEVTDRNADAALGTSMEGFKVLIPISEDYPDRPALPGQRVLAVVTSVTPELIVASRIDFRLVTGLLAGFVPELTSGAVRVMAVARDPGHRTKVAVAATTPGIDPVAACVGRASRRVTQVVNLLGGERVEIIAWHPDRKQYLANALAPGQVNHVEIDEDGEATVWTSPHLMAATVGEAGQNALLAGRLVGVRVHVERGEGPVGADSTETHDEVSADSPEEQS